MNHSSTFHIYHVATNQFHPLYDDLIRGLSAAIRDLGFSCSVAINRYEPSAINILVGSTIFASRYHQLSSRLRGKPYVVYQLEQLDDKHGLLSEWPEYLQLLRQATMVWDYGPSSANFLRSRLSSALAYVPPAYHPTLKSPVLNPTLGAQKQDIDVLFYGSPHPRRQLILDALQKRGLRVVYLHAVFGRERDQQIARAKIVLNIHAWDALPILETVRLSFLLANRVFVISENSDHNPYGGGVVFAPYEQLVDTCVTFLRHHQLERDEIAELGFNNSSKLKQAEVARPAVEASVRELYRQRDRLSRGLSRRVTWALGRIHESHLEVDHAMGKYQEANQMRLLDEPQTSRDFNELIRTAKLKACDPLLARGPKDWMGSTRGSQLLFIVGMPFSGSERLARRLSHQPSWTRYRKPGVASSLLRNLSVQVGADGLPAGWDFLEALDLDLVAQQWLAKLKKTIQAHQFVADAGRLNFLFVGLLRRCFPGARFVSLTTDPMEACLVALAGGDGDGVAFAQNQEALADYAMSYQRLVAMWRDWIPPTHWIEVDERRLQRPNSAELRRLLRWLDPESAAVTSPEMERDQAAVSQERSANGRLRWLMFASLLRPLFGRLRTLYSPAQQSALEAELLHREGVASYRAGDLESAIERYQRVLLDYPGSSGVLNSLGFALQDLDRLEEAQECFAKAVALDPDASMARLNLGLLQLKLGQWKEGWDNYEIRWKGSAEASLGTLNQPVYPLPQWQGEPNVESQHLLVVAEQGYGDTFQFSRYLDLACQRFRSVSLMCSEPTRRLMEWSFGDRVKIFSKVPADYSRWDCYSPMMSLPRAFNTRIDSIPCAMPTLKVPHELAESWRSRVKQLAPIGLRVGIAWAGRRTHQFDARRSLSLEQIEPNLRRPGIVWFSLQKWGADEQASEIPGGLSWVDLTNELHDFGDTAGLIEGLDLVITIDSAMAHLAASLDRPVWMLNRFDSEWRWLRRRSDSPWYPSMRIFNQPSFGDWASVLRQVDQALAERAEDPGRLAH